MSLGGGAFGNDPDWIHDAMRCALSRVQSGGLDVRIVARVSVSSALEALADSAMRLKTSQGRSNNHEGVHGTTRMVDVEVHHVQGLPRTGVQCLSLFPTISR